MDPRERADATLARARARGPFVVTPESAISPMDAANTLQIPRSVVSAIDEGDPETTMVVPAVSDRHGVGPSARLEEGPAIAQEATTQVLPTPLAWAPQRPPAPPPEPEQLDGLVPTIKPPTQRSNLSQRLDG